MDKWKAYCGGSALLAWLTFSLAAIWLVVGILSLCGLHAPVAVWLTLPSAARVFITRPWTLLTYMWVHFEFLHMLFNVLWLYWFGRIMLSLLPERSLAVAFFGGGVAGGLTFLLSAALGYGSGMLCGCSAAVIAGMCAAAVRMPDYPLYLFLIGEVKLKWVAVGCCILTFLGGGGNQAAHVGGLIWGVAYGLWPVFRQRYSSSSTPKRTPDRMVRVLQTRQDDIRRLDELLDKIRLSGYDSLSKKERKELNEISSRIKK